MIKALAVVCVLCAAPALASSARINLQVPGKQAKKVRVQLTKTLCREFTCVSPKKGESVPVDAIVYAEVSRKRVGLKVFTDPSAPDVSETFGLAKKGTLGSKQLTQVVAAVSGVVAAE
ncbi:MAG: hypothetical protein AMXMBFR34_20610 [Myxococcaceae bacterium]